MSWEWLWELLLVCATVCIFVLWGKMQKVAKKNKILRKKYWQMRRACQDFEGRLKLERQKKEAIGVAQKRASNSKRCLAALVKIYNKRLAEASRVVAELKEQHTWDGGEKIAVQKRLMAARENLQRLKVKCAKVEAEKRVSEEEQAKEEEKSAKKIHMLEGWLHALQDRKEDEMNKSKREREGLKEECDKAKCELEETKKELAALKKTHEASLRALSQETAALKDEATTLKSKNRAALEENQALRTFAERLRVNGRKSEEDKLQMVLVAFNLEKKLRARDIRSSGPGK